MYNLTDEGLSWYPNCFDRIVIKILGEEVWLTENDLKSMMKALEESEEG